MGAIISSFEDMGMTIKEIRYLTGLSQAEFGKQYNIPLTTIKKWESSPDNQNHRECPPYVNQLLERVVRTDYSDSDML